MVDELHRLDDLEGVEGDATYGDPGGKLAAFSSELDMLVIGSCSYGPLGRLFTGSTSNYLVRHAHCPLLLLPSRVHDPGELLTREREVSSGASARR